MRRIGVAFTLGFVAGFYVAAAVSAEAVRRVVGRAYTDPGPEPTTPSG